MSDRKKAGRPSRAEHRETLHVIAFKADSEVERALVELEGALHQPGGHAGRRSQAIRKAILEARDRLHQLDREKV